MFTLLHKLFIILHRLRLFDIYEISDLEKCVHYTAVLGLPWKKVLSSLRSIYGKIDDDSKWKTEKEFVGLLDPIELEIYKCDVPESTYFRTLISMLTSD